MNDNLFEATKTLEREYALELLKSKVKEFNDKIYPVEEDEFFDFGIGKIYWSTHRQGTTSFGWDDDDNKFICLISFNGNLFKEGLEDILINTIWHELCHYAVWKELVKRDVMQHQSFDDGPRPFPDREDEYEEANADGGHGPLWLKFAEQVNNILRPKLQITSHCSQNEIDRLFAAHDDEDIDYEIKCENPECEFPPIKGLDFDMEEENERDLVFKFLLASKGLISSPICKFCGKKVYITIYNEKLRDYLDDHIVEIMMYMMDKKMRGNN